MKCLICTPPSFYGKDITGSTKFPPLSLVYLGTVLQKAGHEVLVIDSLAFDYTCDDLMEKIKRFQPDIIGMTATTSIINNAVEIAKLVRAYNPNIKIIIGGIHATADPDNVLKTGAFDYLVRGEGEITIVELVDRLEKNKDISDIRGMSYLKNSKVVHNPTRPFIENIDDIPFPNYKLLPFGTDKYFAPYSTRLPFCSMITSRGCPFQCIFCAHSLIFGRKYRFHSAERSIDEIKYMIDNFGIKEIAFKDSEFTLNKKRVMEFSRLVNEEKLDITWTVNSRVGHVDEPLLQAMKSAGCISTTFGIEAGSQRILDILKKQITLEGIRKTVKITKKAGIRTVLNFMIGNPYETREDIENTIKLSRELNPDYGYFGFTTPFPGTELRRMAIENNWMLVKSSDAVRYERLMMNATSLSNEELSSYLNKAYRSFYMNPKFILKRLHPKNLTWQQMKNDMDGAKKLIMNTLRRDNVAKD